MLPPKIVFCASQGRVGTKYLSYILGLFDRAASLHEPEPNFAKEMLPAQTDPQVAIDFLRDKKLPAIKKFSDHSLYAETSHMWCFGLLEAWLGEDIRPVPDLVILDRPLRKIASSMHALGLVPGQNNWYVNPFGPGALTKWRDGRSWNNYQKAYAYCLEIEERKKRFAGLVRQQGGKVSRTTAIELSTWKGLFRLKKELGLPRLRLPQLYRFAFLKGQRLNNQNYAKKEVRPEALDETQLETWETELLGFRIA
jgi:hypothetical protein